MLMHITHKAYARVHSLCIDFVILMTEQIAEDQSLA